MSTLYDRDDLSWLQTMIGTVRRLAEWRDQQTLCMVEELAEDPAATNDMLIACQALHDRLAAQLPPEEPPPAVQPTPDPDMPF